jgi:dihydrolipoamide dehydrogenase
MSEFDCAVIGGGPGGYVCAIRLAQLGCKTVLIEKAELGGECTNFGCIPSKHLISYASKIGFLRSLIGDGLADGAVTPVLAEHVRASREVIGKLRQGIAFLLNTYGVKVIKGHADIPEPGTVNVKDEGRIKAKSIVVATGSIPSSLPTMPTDANRIINYERALFLESLPRTMLVVGGGAVGLELGTAYAKLGVKVIVVEVMEQLLPGFDRDASRAVRRSLEKMGVEVHLSTTVSEYRYEGNSVWVKLSNDNSYTVDYILSAVGKRPSEWSRRLEEIGVELDPKGFIKTDEHMETSVENIYAVGDVTGPPFLAHRASRQGIVAAENIAGMDTKFNNKAIPYGVFTDPEVAATGLGEDEVRARGGDFRIARFPFSSLGRALADGAADGFTKIIFDDATKVVHGVVVVGPHATEIASEASLAVEMGLTVHDLTHVIHIHPTYAESMSETSHLALRRGIHYVTR